LSGAAYSDQYANCQDSEAVVSEKFVNRLLSSLDAQGVGRLSTVMKRVTLKAQDVLYLPDERITEIYFPENCAISMLTIMKNGACIESATVGCEGASWISASFRSPTMPCQTMVAIPGTAYRLPTDAIELEIQKNGRFHNILSHYSHALLIQTLRSTACNGLHTVEQRCSRWILATLDRVNLEQFEITQEFLAKLLGVQRTGITQVIGRLLSEGILTRTERGHIRLGDKEKLEETACECYGIMKKQFSSKY
jgi:CRP-like cAMP-binding protein